MYSETDLSGQDPDYVWSDRFPQIISAMKRKGLVRVIDLFTRAQELSPEFSKHNADVILRGVVTYFNPEIYIANWHPDCVGMAKALDVHVSRLFPIPDDWDGPRANTLERREYLLYREKFLKKVQEQGFSSLRDLAGYLGFAHQSLNTAIAARQDNYKQDGEWTTAAQKVAEALQCSPEELFGIPHSLSTARRQWKHAAITALSPLPDPEDPYCPAKDSLLNYDLDHLPKVINEAFLEHNAQQRYVLTSRFGLNGLETEARQHEIADEMGVTRQRVQQIETRGMGILRRRDNQHILAAYVESLDI